MTLLLAVLVLAMLAGSFLASGSETGIYTFHPLRARLLAEAGRPGSRALQRLFQRPVALVATLLIANNGVNSAATTFALALAARLGVGAPELVTFAVLTPLFFVFGEALPKNLFRVEANRLLPWIAPALHGAVVALRWLTWPLERLMARVAPDDARRADVFSRPGLGDALSGPEADGILTATQRMMAGNVVNAASGTVRQAMEPLGAAAVVGIDDRREQVEEAARRTGESRFFVRDHAGRLVGMIHLYDVLLDEDSRVRVRRRLRAISRFLPQEDVLTAIGRMRERGHQLAVVEDEGGRVLGTLRLGDLVNEIVGEMAAW